MSSNTQKAISVVELRKPVTLGEREIPTPKAGEILVKVASAQVLPHDAYGREMGLFIGERLPAVIGSSLSGTVEKLGPDADSSFEVGDRVFGLSDVLCTTSDQGGLQQYAILAADALALVPNSINMDEAATLPVNIATIAIIIFTKEFGFEFPGPWENKSHSFADEPVVVLGAGTNVARLFTRIVTKVLGVKNVIAVASLSNEAELREAGASHVIDRYLSDDVVIEKVHAAAGGAQNVTRIIDCASWDHHLATAIFATEKPSRLATLHPVDQAKVHETRPQCTATLVLGRNPNLGPHAKPFWNALPQWIEGGIVRPTAYHTIEGLDVDAVNKQLDEYVAGKGLVQLIVHP